MLLEKGVGRRVLSRRYDLPALLANDSRAKAVTNELDIANYSKLSAQIELKKAMTLKQLKRKKDGSWRTAPYPRSDDAAVDTLLRK